MSDRTSIEWADATWNPIRARYLEIQNDGSGKERIGWHCSHVSEGCRHCYAERLNTRLGTGRDYKPGVLFRDDRVMYANGKVKLYLDEKMLTQPLRWKRPRAIFVGSMTDLFADFVPDEWIDQIFAVMALAPQHRFMVLTKRPERMREYLLETWQPLPNVWLGTSVEDQATADARIPKLLATPAAKRFLSAEPLLGPVDLRYLQPLDPPVEIDAVNGTHGVLRPHGGRSPALDWVIAGGESGPKARPMHPDWARALRDQCAAAGVPFLFKQWGEWVSVSELAGPGRHFKFPDGATVRRTGKKLAGRTLDHAMHDAQPGDLP
ncbi:MAG TPA: phage Gp37/Gp68 family protein [Bradyrhizobium sp.]|nr:phage Gp37/Gp68 family protein [Bradyrhizobium sp.]